MGVTYEGFERVTDLFCTPRTATQIEIKKFNKDGQLCQYESKDLTGLQTDEKTMDIFIDMLEKLGYEVNIKKHTYFGIYDPCRIAELIEIYPTNEQLLERELLWSGKKK